MSHGTASPYQPYFKQSEPGILRIPDRFISNMITANIMGVFICVLVGSSDRFLPNFEDRKGVGGSERTLRYLAAAASEVFAIELLENFPKLILVLGIFGI